MIYQPSNTEKHRVEDSVAEAKALKIYH